MTLAAILLGSATAGGHCEIPCGIYDDQMRVNMILEHASTIEKSMQQIARGDEIPANQMVRWTMNKEDHANGIQEIVTQYFMTQRIKPDTKGYTEKLVLLHKILVYAMKCKQTTDLGNVKKVRSLVEEFRGLYFSH
jgi:nickel superoxide dismutase